MKLRKILSLAVVAAVVMTNAVIMTVPTAYAAANSPAYNTTTRYADTFDTYTSGIGNYTSTGNGLKTFDWYAADHDELFTDFTAEPYTITTKFAQLNSGAKAGNSGYGLVICSANEQFGTAGSYVIREYGYGRSE